MSAARRYLLIPRAVIVHSRHLLLVRSTAGTRSPSAARWHLPGTEVLEGESPQTAIQRLVKLRTRIEIEVDGCLDAVARRGRDPTTGRQSPLLHLFFSCSIAPGTSPDLLPAAATSVAALERDPPPGGPDWGWTDLASGMAALRHDIVGTAVVTRLEELALQAKRSS